MIFPPVSTIITPKSQREKWGEWQYSQYNIYNVVNVNKAINDNIYTWGFLMGPMPMELRDG